MGKIPPKRVDASDCVINVGRRVKDGVVIAAGTAYEVHKGEWVDVLPLITTRQFLSLQKLIGKLNEPDPERISKGLDELCEDIASKLLDWNWTDLDGNSLPKPYKHPEVIKALYDDEIMWLLAAIQGETPGQRKNELKPSE